MQPRQRQSGAARHRRRARFEEAQEDRSHRGAHARQRHRHQLLLGAAGARLEHAPPAGRAGHHGLSGRALQTAPAVRLRCGGRIRRPVHGGGQLFRHRGLIEAGRQAGRLRQLLRLPVEPGHPAYRLPEAAAQRAGQGLSGSGPGLFDGLGCPARPGADQRHAQLQRAGHRAHGHHRQHHRRLPIHRADLSEPACEVESLRRVHGGQPLHGA